MQQRLHIADANAGSLRKIPTCLIPGNYPFVVGEGLKRLFVCRQAYLMIRAKNPHIQIEKDELGAETNVDLIAKEFEIELAVGRLDERCQRLIRYLYFDSKEPTYAEIAANLGMLVASIGPTRARCLDKLKKLVTP